MAIGTDYSVSQGNHHLRCSHSEGSLEVLVVDIAGILITLGYLLVLIGHVMHTFFH